MLISHDEARTNGNKCLEGSSGCLGAMLLPSTPCVAITVRVLRNTWKSWCLLARLPRIVALCALIGLAKLCQLLVASCSFSGVSHMHVVGGGARTSNALLGMKQMLRREQEGIYDALYSNYGDFADLVFNRTEIMTDFVITSAAGTNRSSISMHRLKRRIKRKVLQHISGGNATSFVWVTSGNSVAAGHGNLLHQSYTGVMERAMKPVFASVGLKLETRLRAFSAVKSAPEVALCMESYFGTDVDILGWDFAVTDSRDTWRYRAFANRAGLMPSMPTILMLSGPAQLQVAFELEQYGQAVLGIGDHNPLKKRLPDSLEHPNPAELPPAVQYYLCKGSEITPPCNDHKYNGTPCEETEIIRGRANWHPGWRDNMLRGYVYSLFLVEVLNESLDELIEEVGTTNENAILAKYKHEESADSTAFLKSYPKRDVAGMANMGEDLYSILLRGNALCHSMRQSSQARCEGLVDGIEGISAQTLGKCQNRDHYTFETLPDVANATLGELPRQLKAPWMVASDTHFRHDCNVTVAHDFADSFIVRHDDGWMGDLYPNERMQKAYDHEMERRGLVIMCERMYKGMVMPPEFIGFNQLGGPNVTIVVDDQEVTGIRSLQKGNLQPGLGDCAVLVHRGGEHDGTNSTNFGTGMKNGRQGQYEIRFRVNEVGKMLDFTSVIVI